jgi:hypothetical protein
VCISHADRDVFVAGGALQRLGIWGRRRGWRAHQERRDCVPVGVNLGLEGVSGVVVKPGAGDLKEIVVDEGVRAGLRILPDMNEFVGGEDEGDDEGRSREPTSGRRSCNVTSGGSAVVNKSLRKAGPLSRTMTSLLTPIMGRIISTPKRTITPAAANLHFGA